MKNIKKIYVVTTTEHSRMLWSQAVFSVPQCPHLWNGHPNTPSRGLGARPGMASPQLTQPTTLWSRLLAPPFYRGENWDPVNAQGHRGAKLALGTPTLGSPLLTRALRSTSAQHLAPLAPTQAQPMFVCCTNEDDSPSGMFAPSSLGKISWQLFGVLIKNKPIAWLTHPGHPSGLSLKCHFLRGCEQLPLPYTLAPWIRNTGRINQNQWGWWVGTHQGTGRAVILTFSRASFSYL